MFTPDGYPVGFQNAATGPDDRRFHAAASWFAFVYNAAGIPIAAGVLYPAFGLLLSPVIAAAAMALSSISVIVNAWRLRAQHLG